MCYELYVLISLTRIPYPLWWMLYYLHSHKKFTCLLCRRYSTYVGVSQIIHALLWPFFFYTERWADDNLYVSEDSPKFRGRGFANYHDNRILFPLGYSVKDYRFPKIHGIFLFHYLKHLFLYWFEIQMSQKRSFYKVWLNFHCLKLGFFFLRKTRVVFDEINFMGTNSKRS